MNTETEKESVVRISSERAEKMSSAERLAYINALRHKILSEGDAAVSEDELRSALACLRVERKSRHESPRARSAEPAPAFRLEDF